MAKDAIPYPDMPNTPAEDPSVTSAVFWRAAWLRDLAEREALERLARKQHALKRHDHVTNMALAGACCDAQRELEAAFAALVRHGGLLFAWAPDTKGAAR
jgi:hypothetical protein